MRLIDADEFKRRLKAKGYDVFPAGHSHGNVLAVLADTPTVNDIKIELMDKRTRTDKSPMENEKNKTASDTLRLCEVFTEVGNRYGIFHKWINDKDEHNRTRVSAIIEYTDGTCEIIRIGRFRFLDYLAERILEPYITK